MLPALPISPNHMSNSHISYRVRAKDVADILSVIVSLLTSEQRRITRRCHTISSSRYKGRIMTGALYPCWDRLPEATNHGCDFRGACGLWYARPHIVSYRSMTVTGLKKQIALTTQGGRSGRTGLLTVCHQAVSKVALGVTSDGGSVMDMVAD